MTAPVGGRPSHLPNRRFTEAVSDFPDPAALHAATGFSVVRLPLVGFPKAGGLLAVASREDAPGPPDAPARPGGSRSMVTLRAGLIGVIVTMRELNNLKALMAGAVLAQRSVMNLSATSPPQGLRGIAASSSDALWQVAICILPDPLISAARLRL